MEITLLGIHSNYGIRLWKFGIILLRTTTIDLPWLTLFSEDASRSQMPVACGQGIRSTYYFVFPLINLCFVDTLLTRDVGVHIWAKLKEGGDLKIWK